MVMAANRERVRDEVVTRLTAALVGTGLPTRQVLGHKAGRADFATGTPLVAVLGAGSRRTRMTMAGTRLTAHLEIHTLVLSASRDGTWTEAMAEDALDAIDAGIATWISAHPKGPSYQNLMQSETSKVDELDIGGEMYLVEITPITAEIYG